MFYMIGLPTQTRESVAETVKYTERLYAKFKGKRLFPFISPLAPFLDPGGNAFEHSDKHGFKVLARTLEEHFQLATMPSWKHVLNYETNWMTRSDIVDSTYSAGLGLNEIKRKMGLISEEVASRTKERTLRARELSDRIDQMIAKAGSSQVDLESLRDEASCFSESTVCDKEELDWSESSYVASVPRVLVKLLIGR